MPDKARKAGWKAGLFCFIPFKRCRAIEDPCVGLQSKLEATWWIGEGLRQGGGWQAAAFVLGRASVMAVVMKMVERCIPESFYR